VSTALVFALSAVLVFGGFWVMSLAFSVGESLAAWVFFAGIALDALGLWIAFGVAPHLKRP